MGRSRGRCQGALSTRSESGYQQLEPPEGNLSTLGVSRRLFPRDDLSENNPPLLKISPLILRHRLKVGPQ